MHAYLLIHLFAGQSRIFDCPHNVALTSIYFSELDLISILKPWSHCSDTLMLLMAPGIIQYSIMPIQCQPHFHISTHILLTSPKILFSPPDCRYSKQSETDDHVCLAALRALIPLALNRTQMNADTEVLHKTVNMRWHIWKLLKCFVGDVLNKNAS